MTAAVWRPYRPMPAVSRRFVALVLLSVLLHGSLFAWLSWSRPSVSPPLPPLLATLRLLPLPESATPAAAPVPPALPQKVRQSPAVLEARPSPRLQGAAGPTIAPAVAVPTVADALAAPAATAAPAALPAPVEATVAAAPPVTQAVAPAPDLLAAYRRRLGELLAGQQDYPRVAALRGWEGEVRLRLRVARKGNLLAVVVDRSSGFNVLDQHALALLADLGSLPPLPEGLEGNEIQVVVPITYKLNKTT